MRGPRGWKEYWRSHKGPFQRPWQYRGLKRKDEKEEDDDLFLFVAQIGALIAAGKIKKPETGETIRVKYKK